MINTSFVDVCMISYNHEKYIAQAIEGVLSQKTVFPFRLVISDDGSSDGTPSIIDSYVNLYPNIVVSISDTNNVGMMKNFLKTLNYCTNTYVALCEGDDYWIDPLKLQKQINFLEKNKKYSICFHNMKIEYENDSSKNKLSNTDSQKVDSNILDLADGNYIYTASCVFRNNIKNYPASFISSPVGDYFLHMLNAKCGNIHYLPDVMGVYRIHDGGVWASKEYIPTVMKWFKAQGFVAKEFSGEIQEQLYKAQFKTFSMIINSQEVSKKLVSEFIQENSEDIIEMMKYIGSQYEKYRISVASMEYKVGSLLIKPLRNVLGK